MFFLRQFQPGDFHQVIDIEQRVFQEHDPYVYMELYESVADGFYVAVDSGKVVGYVVGFLSMPGKGRIFTLAVEEGYRNRGIGTRLMERICDLLKIKGAKGAALEVRLSNVSAQQFYLRRGFVPAWVERGYYSDGEDAVVMKKEL